MATDNKKLNELIAETIMNDTAGQLKEIVAEKINEIEKEQVKKIDKFKKDIKEKLEDLETKVKEVPISFTFNKKNLEDGDRLVHSAFETVMKVLTSAKRINKNIMLVGGAGSGKSSLCKDVADALELDYYPMSVGIQTTKSDLLGFINAKGEYVTSPVRQAFENGGVLLLDEFDATHAGVVTILNSLLANDVCSFPDKIIHKNEKFVCIVACNTYGRGGSIDYIGRNKLDSATLDRFVVVNVDYDDRLEGLLTRNETWVNIIRKMRDNAKKFGLKVIISPRASMQGADLLDAGFHFSDVLNMVVYKGLSDEIKTQLIKDIDFKPLTKQVKNNNKKANANKPIRVKINTVDKQYTVKDIQEDTSILKDSDWKGCFNIWLSATTGFTSSIDASNLYMNAGTNTFVYFDNKYISKLIRELETYGDSIVVENQPIELEIVTEKETRNFRLG